ncbi:MAG TPA: methyltransferase domain-containing protein [Blastocatellia bacterium]|nr:methyltransferase domain-containing protein [Blastocatellia bacterium]
MKTRRREPEEAGAIRLLARTIRGAEWIGAAEVEGRTGARVSGLGHREIRFRVERLEPGLLELGSLDDLFLIGSDLRDLDHTRASLAPLAAQAAAVDHRAALALVRRIRTIPPIPSFTVVASFLGRRNYNRYEIEESVAGAIRSQTNWPHLSTELEETERANLTFRVHLSDAGGFIGLRLPLMPLHRRPYKVASRTGTLHPPLAYAMAMLCGLRQDSAVLDPCCGVGTIPIEAARLEPSIRTIGSDLDREVLDQALSNMREAGRQLVFMVADAGRVPLADASIDRVICNPPWGRTVNAGGLLAADAGRLLREIGRVLRPDGRAALIAEREIIEQIDLHHSGLKLIASIPISLFGTWPNIYLMVPESSSSISPIDTQSRFGQELERSLDKSRLF